ncbi:peptidylprolyl isomerase fpr3 [Dimargaris cristalligena]|nr:peptidylprolyl isomerase fpr3 [Dimargaris cristalligena]
MLCGFWGLQIQPNKAYMQKVDASFCLTMAALDEKIADNQRTVVKVTVDDKSFVLCSLLPGKLEQQPLNITFTEGEQVTFFLNGSNAVHLTGNYTPEEDIYGDGDDDDEIDSDDMEGMEHDHGDGCPCSHSEDDDEELSELDSEDEGLSVEELAKKYGVTIEELLEQMNESDDDDDDKDDSDVEDAGQTGRIREISIVKSADNASDSESDDDDYLDDAELIEEDQEIEDIDEEDLRDEVLKIIADAKTPVKAPEPVKETPASTQKDSKKRKAEESAKSAKTAESGKTPNKKEKKDTAAAVETPKAQAKKDKKAAAAERKEKAAETPKAQAKKEVAAAATPKSADKKEKAAETPKAQAKKEAAEKKATTPAKPTKVTLPGGLIIEDSVIGKGKECSRNNRIGMRYVGKLTNGKVFDQNTKGTPFNFVLGRGEVIKGWDQGIVGMKEGGERRLTIPAGLAYGSQGAPPDIPRNATLVFDVKLVTIKK